MTASIYTKMRLETSGEIAIITFDNGENRVDESFLDELDKSLNEVERDPTLKILITTSTGKYYSNGLDLEYLSEKVDDLEYLQRFGLRTQRILCKLMSFPLITIAALNGHAFALGAFLALCHDVIIMNSDRGWIAANEIHLGLRVGRFFTTLCRSKLSSSVCHRLLVIGERLSAADAVECGLVQQACPEEQLHHVTTTTAARLARLNLNRQAMTMIKKDLYETLMRLEHDLPMEEIKSRL